MKRSNNELQIKVLEEEVNTLKSQINQLATLHTDLSDKLDEFTKNKHEEKEIVEQICVKKDKFKCNICGCTL